MFSKRAIELKVNEKNARVYGSRTRILQLTRWSASARGTESWDEDEVW